MKKQYVIKIKGQVQSVGFRFFIREKARSLNIKGFVRNQDNGDVYVLAQGEKDDLIDLLDSCSEGPDMAKVRKVEHSEQALDEDLGDFEIIQH